MPDKSKIPSYELILNGEPHLFVIKTMEEIDQGLGGIADIPHRHNYYSVIWPFTATGKHYIDFREYPILPDHIFFVSPEQVHQVVTDPDPTGIVILFTPEFLERNSIRKDFIANLKLFRTSDDTPPLPLTPAMAEKLRLFANPMLDEFNSPGEMSIETIGAYLKLFIIECNGHCSLHMQENTQSLEVGRSLVKSFKELVEKHYIEKHQVQYYAEALNVTPNYLNEVIRASLGFSAKDYIQTRLVLEAKRMVIFTEQSSKEIGFALGFEDPSHFSKFFKTNTGSTLQEFRGHMPGARTQIPGT
jgi:AraC family transcriptional regulator, transcriptional activator of pobA